MTIKADPVQIGHLAGQVDAAATLLTDSWRTAAGETAVPASAFGDTAGAAACHGACQGMTQAFDTAAGNLVQVLQIDVDNLYLAAFHFQSVDEKNADGVGSSVHAGIRGRDR